MQMHILKCMQRKICVQKMCAYLRKMCAYLRKMCAYLRQELDNEEATSDLAVHYKYKYIFRANMWPHVVSFLVTVTQTGKVDALEQFFRGAL